MDAEEAQWIAASRAGDREAFGQLVQRYQNDVYHLARRMLHDAEEARDVAQDAFVRAYTHLDQFRLGEPFRPWLMRIATNLTLDRLRQAKNQTLPLYDTLPANAPADDPEAAAVSRDELQALRRALAALPEEYRLLVVLAHLQHRSYQEIMEMTGLSLTLVKNRLYRARLMLKEALSDAPVPVGGNRP